MKKVFIFIQARIRSTRLPGKIFINIFGETVLERIIRATKKVINKHNIFILTGDRSDPFILKSICKKIPISLDTRKSEIMQKGIKLGVKIINDVSGLNYDPKTINILNKYKIPFVLQHSQGTPENMQNNQGIIPKSHFWIRT